MDRRPGPGRDGGARRLRRGRRRPATGSTSSTGADRRPGVGHRRPGRARPRPRARPDGLDLDAGRAPAARPPARRRDGPARPRPVGCPDRGRRVRPRRARRGRRRRRRGSGPAGRDRTTGSSSPATGSARSWPPPPRATLGPRCAGLVLVDGGWESIEASTGLDVDTFLRGLDEPPEVLALDGGVPRRPGGLRSRPPGTRTRSTQRGPPSSRRMPARSSRDPAARARGVRAHDVRVRPDRRRSRAVAAPVVALAAAASGDDAPGVRDRALAAASDARVAAGRGPIRLVSFGHDGHNLMRYRPDAVSAAILEWPPAPPRSRSPEPDHAGRLHARPPRPRHHRRDVHGRGRSRRTRSPSGPRSSARRSMPTADSREANRPSTATAPITAVHDPGLVRVPRGRPGPRSAGSSSPRPFLSADTYPNRADVRGHERRGDASASSASRSRRPGGPGSGAWTRRRRWSRARTWPRAAPSTSP